MRNVDLGFMKENVFFSTFIYILDKMEQSYAVFMFKLCNNRALTVKPVLTTIFLKRPPVLNDHDKVLP